MNAAVLTDSRTNPGDGPHKSWSSTGNSGGNRGWGKWPPYRAALISILISIPFKALQPEQTDYHRGPYSLATLHNAKNDAIFFFFKGSPNACCLKLFPSDKSCWSSRV